MKIVACSLAALLLAAPLRAETARFDVTLAGIDLGAISVTREGDDARIDSVMDNTPLGVGDGTYEASVTGGAYRSVEVSGAETRRIEVDYSGGAVSRVSVTPESEATAASDPAQVPAGVIDPAQGLARIALARDCVGPFQVYDGRRVVSVGLSARTLDADTLVCDYAYRVTGGPGHLSPFRFTEISLRASYDLESGTVTGARDIAVSAGPFTVRLVAH
ncbi:DUF3108 domain-containing protein [Palleronia sp. LCG004]|uniref:DUF3108 domain-containing protein n=1 Tax=Palleronia sp. LCG004 TaxID=3079304 RepID=UPI0029430598|nr:DUF3108 domain-containing protein [Palleronia sp. LCG004]WOI55555.1 DUF3108 domain-containing protein [Palleronia sp. LCG004]